MKMRPANIFIIPCILLSFIAGIPAMAALDDGLALYYNFDADEVGTVTDLSGNGHVGAVNGATFTPDGYCGGAFHFDGNQSYVLAGNLGHVPEGTISFWMSADAVENWRNVFTTDYASWDDCLRFEEDSDGNFVVGLGPILGGAYYTTTLQPLTWHHVVFAWTTNGYEGWLDGSLEFSAAHNNELYLNFNNVALGNGYSTSANRYWKGMIDEVRIYNRVLTAQEIMELYTDCPSVGGGDAPYICLLGFSNDPEGDQDVTEFYSDETLYVSVQDVDLDENDPKTVVTAHLIQRGPTRGSRRLEKRIKLERQESGAYTGSIPLDALYKGEALVIIQASSPQSLIFSRHSIIRIMSAVEKDGFINSGGRPSVNPSSK